MDEFSFIEKYLSPLTFGNADALALKDDAAIISPKPGHDLVITKDAIAEGVHFFPGDDPRNLAKKLLRVNLSDLAAKGATPYCVFMALAIPTGTTQEWLINFTTGLKDDLKNFSCFLAGGDTVTHNGPLVLSLTALGYIKTGEAILRNGAKAGDLVFVTGSIGDSYMGLQLLQNKASTGNADYDDFLKSRYHLPQPRISVGLKLAGIATSAIDISDGLPAELTHICKCSKVGAEIHLNKIPFSPALLHAAKTDAILPVKAIIGGDDYELLFTAPESKLSQIKEIASETRTPITPIGKIIRGNNIAVLDRNLAEIPVTKSGFKHKIG